MAISQAQGASRVDVAGFIDQQPVGGFQIKLLLACAAVLFLDGFDTTAIGFVAPSLAREWSLTKGALGPVLLVVAHVDAQHVSSWWREKISIRSRHSRRTVRIQRLATAFALGAVPVFG